MPRPGLYGPAFDLDFIEPCVPPPVPSLVPPSGVPELLGTPGQELHGIIGPPGTGKTTAMTDKLIAEIDSGVDPKRIAFVAFTKAAATEGLQRVMARTGLSRKELPHFRTLHSLCWRIMGAPGDVLGPEHLQDFSEKHGWQLTLPSSGRFDPLAWSVGGTSRDDDLYTVYEWSRARRMPLEEGQRRCPVRVPLPRLQRFAEDLQQFKDDRSLFDFADMLEFVIRTERTAEVDVAFVDEVQDLSPLQITAIELLFRYCKRVYLSGDDDQAIYGWAGADPTWMLALKQRCSSFDILPKSHRVPSRIQAFADRIIQQNRGRVPKLLVPRDECEGRILVMHELDAICHVAKAAGTTFVLARNFTYLRTWRNSLTGFGIPHRVEGPKGDSLDKPIRALQCACDLKNGKPIDPDNLRVLLDYVPKRDGELLPKNASTRLDALTQGTTRNKLEQIGFGAFLEALDSAPNPVDVMTRLSAEQRVLLARSWHLNGDANVEPRITLSTIHRAKGRECDTVVVLPQMSTASFNELTKKGPAGKEAEHRAAYVAVTRPRDTLILVKPTGSQYFPYEWYLPRGR